MNNGLPSLLDAIFGKNNFASISLEEMNEVIKEFPSFNAGHFFLSKKLKQENDSNYERTSQRTALYFNNPFWLQSVLNEGSNGIHEEMPVSVKTERPFDFEEVDYRESHEEPARVEPEMVEPETSEPETVEPISKFEETVFEEPIPIEEEVVSVASTDEVIPLYNTESSVTSFDELIAKYKTEEKNESEMNTPFEETVFEEPIPIEEEVVLVASTDEVIPPYNTESPVTSFDELMAKYKIEENDESEINTSPELTVESIPDPPKEQTEVRGEMLNDYGVFEDEFVEETDYDMDAFDRPIEETSSVQESLPIEMPREHTHEMRVDPIEIQPSPDEPIVGNQHTEFRDSNSSDYEAFDRPLDDELMEIESAHEPIVEKLPVFNSKNAESIVFTPYHMVDYFASQGIKLVLEDNPPDAFGKQLKSFTDWLKVMKRLPEKPLLEKTDEREADRIRHFASHSIEERDILTESMAEVLAKQGMYENAIALYQKLSLIYPPKSAYFASRIEQLKASLP